MAKETKPQTYRVSNEVDAELRQLAKKHGGIDKSLRILIRAYDSTAWRRIGNDAPAQLDAVGPELTSGRGKVTMETRGIRAKGDAKR